MNTDRVAPTPYKSVGSLEPLRNPKFKLLWAAGLFHNTGFWMQQVVVGWLVLDLTNSVWQLALVGFYRNAPNFLGLFLGVYVDRLDRRKLVVVAQMVNVLVSALLAILVVSDGVRLWHVAVASVIWGLAWALDFLARRSLIMDVVGRQQLPSAMVLEVIFMNVSRIVGPLLGGLLTEWAGYGGALTALACSHLLSSFAVFLIGSDQGRRTASSESPWHNLIEGLRYVAGNRTIIGVLGITVAANTFAFPSQQLYPVFARDILGVGPSGLGLLTAGTAIGSVIGSLLFASFSKLTKYKGIMFIAGATGFAVSALLFSFSQWYYLSVLLLIVGGIVYTGYPTMQSTLVLISASDAVRGRAMGVLVLAIGTQPLGMLQIGGLATWLGAAAAVGLSNLLCLLLVLFFAVKVAELRRQQ